MPSASLGFFVKICYDGSTKTVGVRIVKYVVNGTILLPDGEAKGRALAFDAGKIVSLTDAVPAGAEVIDAAGGYVSPGLVDVHCHGFMGWDASNGDA